MANIIVKDVAGLSAALKSAQAGDTIKLAAGDYTAFGLNGVKFAGVGVTITSLDTNNEAKLNGFTLRNCEGLTFKDLELKVDPAKANPYQVLDSSRITLDDLDVHGNMNGTPQDDSTGLLIRRSDGVTVKNSDFHEVGFGIGHIDSKNVVIHGNKFHNIGTDGVRGGGTSNITISNNFFTDFDPPPGAHADAIQFWTTNTTTSAENIVVTGNIISRGDGAATQGVFIRDEVGVTYKNITITDNLVVGALGNGIRVNGVEGLVIKNNIVQGLPDILSRISVADAVGVQISGNVSTKYLIEDSATGVVLTGNSTIPFASDGGSATLLSYLSNHPMMATIVDAALLTGTADKAMAAIAAVQAQLTIVTGTAGADKLSTEGLRDTRVEAGDGDDLLVGNGPAANTLIGGAGDDSYRVNSDTTTVVEAANGGDDAVTATVDHVLADNVERLTLAGDARTGTGNELANRLLGSAGNDTLSGMGGDDQIQGNDGDDKASGGVGNDTVYGVAGNDTIAGGDGDDRLRGDDGADSLAGEAGADVLMGGGGADKLLGGLGADTFTFGEADIGTVDTVFDFTRAQGDKVSLASIDANAALTGNQAFAFIGTAAFSKVAGQLRYEVSGGDAYVMGDMNGDGAADFKLLMKGVNSLQSNDFLL